MCIIGEVQLFVEEYHPDTKLANKAVHIFNDNSMMHFRKILHRRQKQLTLDKFLVKKIGRQLQRKKDQLRARNREWKQRQKENYPVFLWRGTSLEKECRQIKYKFWLIIMHYCHILLLCIYSCM